MGRAAVLPDLDREDTWALDLPIVPFLLLVSCWAADAGLMALLVLVIGVRSLWIIGPAASVIITLGVVQLWAIRRPLDGVPITSIFMRAIRFYQSPRRRSVDLLEQGKGPEGLVGPLDVPWRGVTEDGDLTMADGRLVRVLDVPGLDLTLRSDDEQDVLARMWRRLIDGRDAPVEFVAVVERIDTSGRVAALRSGRGPEGLQGLAQAHAGQLAAYQDRTRRRILAAVSADDMRGLDAEEADLIRDLSAMGLRARRVRYLPDRPSRTRERPRVLELLR